jgi:hypothetical protein
MQGSATTTKLDAAEVSFPEDKSNCCREEFTGQDTTPVKSALHVQE